MVIGRTQPHRTDIFIILCSKNVVHFTANNPKIKIHPAQQRLLMYNSMNGFVYSISLVCFKLDTLYNFSKQ
jgi:hypothetical protein